VADGDRIGAAISALESPDSHREFSRALAGFAKQAEEIVKEHNGVLVYAGGDDVLAFLPVDRCLNCARRLHDAFGSCLEKYSKPTLSVGIAIGHFMENLEDLLEQGRLAEKAAKQVENKDALAIHLHKRGGGPIRIQGRWEDNPDERWARYAQLIRQEAIPSKLPYDLRKLAEVYENWIDPALALGADVLRVIRDKQPRKGRDYMPEIVRILEPVTTTLALRSFAEELLVARQLAAALRQANAPLEEAE
jgi:CRISPR-associated protein Cmr2